MKNWKQCTVFAILAIITSVFALVACDTSNGNGNKEQIIITVTGIGEHNGKWAQLWLATNNNIDDMDAWVGGNCAPSVQDGEATFPLIIYAFTEDLVGEEDTMYLVRGIDEEEFEDAEEEPWPGIPLTKSGNYYVFLQFDAAYYASNTKISIAGGRQTIVYSTDTFSFLYDDNERFSLREDGEGAES